MFTAGRQTGQTKEIINYINWNADKYFFVLICNRVSQLEYIKKNLSFSERLKLEQNVICISVGMNIRKEFDELRGLNLDKPLVIFTDVLSEKDRMNVTTKVYESIAPMYKTNDFLHAVVHVSSII